MLTGSTAGGKRETQGNEFLKLHVTSVSSSMTLVKMELICAKGLEMLNKC